MRYANCRVKDALDELAPGNNITMKLTKDGSGRGAAIAAAMATAAEEDGWENSSGLHICMRNTARHSNLYCNHIANQL